jgi:tartronate-semialdehyde synthase
MLTAATRPVIIASGGIINADAADLLVTFSEVTGIPVIPTLARAPNLHPLPQPSCPITWEDR